MNEPLTEKTKMIAGEPYMSNDPELTRDRKRAKALCYRYNQQVEELDKVTLADLLGYATDAYLEPPFYCDYGYNIQLGAGVYANHNLVILDCAPVTIGAGSVVTRSIPPNSVAVGNPCRVLKSLPEPTVT